MAPKHAVPFGAWLCDQLLFPGTTAALAEGTQEALVQQQRVPSSRVARPPPPSTPRPFLKRRPDIKLSGLVSLVAAGGGSSSSDEEFYDAHDGLRPPEQRRALEELRAHIRGLPIALQDAMLAHAATDADLLRFLRVRQYSVARAAAQLQSCVEWRATVPEIQDFSWEKHRPILQCGMSWCNGVDRQGRPLWIVVARRHVPSRSDEVVNVTYTMLEWMIDCLLVSPHENCATIFDMKGYGFKHMDMNWAYRCIGAMQKFHRRQMQLFRIGQPFETTIGLLICK